LQSEGKNLELQRVENGIFRSNQRYDFERNKGDEPSAVNVDADKKFERKMAGVATVANVTEPEKESYRFSLPKLWRLGENSRPVWV